MTELEKVFNELKAISTLINPDVSFNKTIPTTGISNFLLSQYTTDGIMLGPYTKALHNILDGRFSEYTNSGRIKFPFITTSNIML